jgi:alanyl-tRNA synthetase
MTSAQIRQSFLDFFATKQHTIVPSASLMPSSPNLLFTNAGMNQFVPYFLGDQTAPWKRVADTQKCIRAGGKHNDLEDVGFDTYHHTMFEMLGNWSFGDYFKKESLTWGWELLTGDPAKGCWGIPAKRLFATVYKPDKSKGDPADFDQEAYDIWAGLFKAAGLDPAVHIVNGNKKDNFWMMGDTGPCGPCSEIHFNLMPSDDEAEGRKGVNSSSPRCIEIWNHVFIQFNANADGTFAPLAAKHVDTGMGFERVAGIYATTKGFKDFSAEPSNYNADVFKPTFDKIASLSGKTYTGTVPTERTGLSEQQQIDITFRVLADHARCVSCAIADGILPGNEGRNYVIRRILRRGVLYGWKNLKLRNASFSELVAPVVDSLGKTFPELKLQENLIIRVIRAEEESFGRTIDIGLQYISGILNLKSRVLSMPSCDEFKELQKDLRAFKELHVDVVDSANTNWFANNFDHLSRQFLFLAEDFRDVDLVDDAEVVTKIRSAFHEFAKWWIDNQKAGAARTEFIARLTRVLELLIREAPKVAIIQGNAAFKLYDTYGFPLDMTQLLAVERGLSVDEPGFNKLMEEQRERGRAARKTDVIVAATEGDTKSEATKFVGYSIDSTHATHAKLVDVVKTEKDTYLVFDQTPFYAEMGGQVGDTGDVLINDQKFEIVDCIKDKSGRHLHKLDSSFLIPHSSFAFAIGSAATLHVNFARRRAIARQHTSAHLLNWALRKILGTHVRQFGTHKTPDRLRFDFTHFEALTAAQIKEAEQLINEKVIDNAPVYYTVVPHAEVSGRADILQFFGDKYGKEVRVVQIGGSGDENGRARLDGYSMELCGGTHVTTAGEIGVIKIVAEMAIAAGTRRIEAVAGQAALDFIAHEEAALKAVNARLNAGAHDVAQKLEQVLGHQKELEQKLKGFEAKASAALADELAAKAITKDGLKWVSTIVTTDSPETLRSLGSQILHKLGDGAVQLGAIFDGKVSLVAYCSPAAIKAGHQAGKLISGLTAKLGGKGGGKPDFAMGGGGDASKLPEVLKLV